MSFTRASLVLTLSLALSACAKHYTPSPDRPFEPITEFSSTAAVSLNNAQSSEEAVPVYESGKWYGNLNEWTDVAIQIARRELTARGLHVIDGAPKSINMSIESAKTEVGWVKVETQITMRAETGDGYAATYVGRNNASMAAYLPRQIDGAMMRVVVEMLRDPNIISYLRE